MNETLDAVSGATRTAAKNPIDKIVSADCGLSVQCEILAKPNISPARSTEGPAPTINT